MRITKVLNVVEIFLLIAISGTEGGIDAICGNHGTCVPKSQCLKPHEGQCKNVWCCKQDVYKMSPVPAEECICVSNQELCGKNVNPYTFVHLEAACECCDCINQCVPLLSNGLCPTYEKARGECDEERKYCCKENNDKDCKCFKECPESWEVVGDCKKCCLPCTKGKTNVTNNPTCEATNTGGRTSVFPLAQILIITVAIMSQNTKP